MNPMTFPKMLFSHGEGWNWLARIHPSVARMYLGYVLPLSIIPPAMLFYAWYSYRNTVLTEIGMNQALFVVAVFFVTELIVVPVMARVIQRIGQVAEVTPSYPDAFALAAVAPTPLWLAPLILFVPSLLLDTLVMALALLGAGLLIYQGVYKIFHVEEEGHSRLLAAAILAAGLVAWAAMMLLTLVTWGMVIGG